MVMQFTVQVVTSRLVVSTSVSAGPAMRIRIICWADTRMLIRRIITTISVITITTMRIIGICILINRSIIVIARTGMRTTAFGTTRLSV